MSPNKFANKFVLGQYLNTAGIKMTLNTLLLNHQLMVPHLKISSIANIKYDRLHSLGIKYLVFDKDNTITLPYQLTEANNQIASTLRETVF